MGPYASSASSQVSGSTSGDPGCLDISLGLRLVRGQRSQEDLTEETHTNRMWTGLTDLPCSCRPGNRSISRKPQSHKSFRYNFVERPTFLPGGSPEVGLPDRVYPLHSADNSSSPPRSRPWRRSDRSAFSQLTMFVNTVLRHKMGRVLEALMVWAAPPSSLDSGL